MNNIFKLLSEFIGTFILVGVILMSGKPIAIGLGLITAIYLFGTISGGHFNPAVSTVMLFKNDIDIMLFLQYVCAQILGGLVAYELYKATVKK